MSKGLVVRKYAFEDGEEEKFNVMLEDGQRALKVKTTNLIVDNSDDESGDGGDGGGGGSGDGGVGGARDNAVKRYRRLMKRMEVIRQSKLDSKQAVLDDAGHPNSEITTVFFFGNICNIYKFKISWHWTMQ